MFRNLFLLAALAIASLPAAAQPEGEIRLSRPPESIAQWYKPQNERQVWLHTMFRLRRSMQAIGLHAGLEDEERLATWTRRFLEDYRQIPEMVPEWRDEVDFTWARRLEEAAAAGDKDGVGRALNKIGTSCSSCHKEYMAVTRVLYRTPEYGDTVVENPETLEEFEYRDFMQRLSQPLNAIIIGLKDGRSDAALTAADRLATRLDYLGESCSSCHGDDTAPRERILGERTDGFFDTLTASLESGDDEKAGEMLGEIGVNVCARCHGVHRTLSDVKHAMEPEHITPIE